MTRERSDAVKPSAVGSHPQTSNSDSCPSISITRASPSAFQSAIVVALGLQIADSIIGPAITLVILKITWDAWDTARHAQIDLDHIDDEPDEHD